MDDIDFGEDTQRDVSDNELSKLSDLAQDWRKTSAEVSDLEQQLSSAKEQLRVLEQQKIPEAMDAVGMSSFKIPGVNWEISVEDKVHANIPKQNQDKAFEWLRSHNAGSLIKNQIAVSLPKGKDEQAQEAVEKLREIGLDPEVKEAVAWNTLTAWAKEQLAKGENLPLELLGIFVGRVAKVK